MNRTKETNRNTSSRYKGVNFNKNNNKWRSQIGINKVSHHLGYFVSEKQAALAYNKKAVELFGEYASLNEISESED